MARDFRHGPSRRKGFQRQSQQGTSENESLVSQTPVWVWGGLLTFALVGGFFVVNHFASEGVKGSENRSNEIYQPQESVEQQIEPAQPSESPGLVIEDDVPNNEPELVSETGSELEAPRYTFYYDLPQTEVVVDVEPLPIELPEPMWIQAGSFRELAQAQKEKTRLNNAGREVDIAPVETASGTYYRILSGPYTDRLIMNQERNHLRRMGADTRVVKLQTALR
jgi:cell division septation protein DedD